MRNFDIIKYARFRPVNEMFRAVLVGIKKVGKDKTQHKDITTEEDRKLSLVHRHPTRASEESLLRSYVPHLQKGAGKPPRDVKK